MKNKIVPIFLVLSVTIGFSGCGSATTPVANGNVVERTEEMAGNSTETTVESSDEATTKTESKESGSDKPAETVSPTAELSATGKPESTAEPTASPEPTATPEPTPTPHVHEYVESITVQPTCAVVGEKRLTCSCGDSKTEAIPATGNHNWVTQYTLVEHEVLGHVETTEQQVQVGTTRRTEYECSYCGARFDTPSGVVDHCYATGDIDHAFARTIAWDYDEPVYEIQTASEWIIDSPAWTENVPCGETCSVCGATK